MPARRRSRRTKDGNLKASDIYLYAEALRGSGEGRFFEGERLIVNGVVTRFSRRRPAARAA